MTDSPKKTPLYDCHVAAGGKMVDFGGWNMPLNYGSQLEEHHQVRQAAGLFDVSHMTPVDVEGADAEDYLRHLLANDVQRLGHVGKALYSCMLNEAAGVVDDLIVYRRQQGYRVVVNAATRAKDLAWMAQQMVGFEVSLQERADLAMLALQGPTALSVLEKIIPHDWFLRVDELMPFNMVEEGTHMLARTGYTGEDGVEWLMPADEAGERWQQLLDAGARPCGLGARDTLRLEAGMSLYGQDMDETVSPLEAGLAWTLCWRDATRHFTGRTALAAQKERRQHRRSSGFVLAGRGVLRAGMPLYHQRQEVGVLTSGSFSPTLKQAVALGRFLPSAATDAEEGWEVCIRGRWLPLRKVRPVFVRHGQSQLD